MEEDPEEKSPYQPEKLGGKGENKLTYIIIPSKSPVVND